MDRTERSGLRWERAGVAQLVEHLSVNRGSWVRVPSPASSSPRLDGADLSRASSRERRATSRPWSRPSRRPDQESLIAVAALSTPPSVPSDVVRPFSHRNARERYGDSSPYRSELPAAPSHYPTSSVDPGWLAVRTARQPLDHRHPARRPDEGTRREEAVVVLSEPRDPDDLATDVQVDGVDVVAANAEVAHLPVRPDEGVNGARPRRPSAHASRRPRRSGHAR